MEGIGESIRAHVRNYLAEHPDVDLTKLARYAASVSSINGQKSNAEDKNRQGRLVKHGKNPSVMTMASPTTSTSTSGTVLTSQSPDV